MKSQPNRDYVSDDVVMTPPTLARAIVQHLAPQGVVLEPCRGQGAFYRALADLPAVTRLEWCELAEGRDFLTYDFGHDRFDWIITNPPWSKIRPFLQRALALSNHVAFLLTINHMWTKARVREVREAGFRFAEILLTPFPRSFPQSGFQLGVVHVARATDSTSLAAHPAAPGGVCRISYLDWTDDSLRPRETPVEQRSAAEDL